MLIFIRRQETSISMQSQTSQSGEKNLTQKLTRQSYFLHQKEILAQDPKPLLSTMKIRTS